MKTPLHLLDQSVTINREGFTARDSIGAAILTTTTAYTGVAARVQFLSASEAVKAGRPASATTVNFYVPGTYTLTAGDRIVCDGRTFKALGPPLNFDNQDVLLKIMAEEVTP